MGSDHQEETSAKPEQLLEEARRELDDAYRRLAGAEEQIKLAVTEARDAQLFTWVQLAHMLDLRRELVARRYYSGLRGSATTRERVNKLAVETPQAAAVRKRLREAGAAREVADDARRAAIAKRREALEKAQGKMKTSEIATLLGIKPPAVKHLFRRMRKRRVRRGSLADRI